SAGGGQSAVVRRLATRQAGPRGYVIARYISYCVGLIVEAGTGRRPLYRVSLSFCLAFCILSFPLLIDPLERPAWLVLSLSFCLLILVYVPI
ncbi:hypothetical protein T310_5874, partial [Rasamsonia emersonii CBS 393.64]